MLNKYPMWKYLLILVIVSAGFLYALPNIYGEDPALQISATRGGDVEISQLEQVKQALDSNQIPYQSIKIENNQIQVRFKDTDAQLEARDVSMQALGTDFIVALNIMPAQPKWLEDVGGNPMKLGLDLRGGVHFLMEVDMSVALQKKQEEMLADFRSELREQRIRYRRLTEHGNGIKVSFRKEEDMLKAIDHLSDTFRELTIDESRSDENTLTATMSEARVKEVKEYALQQNITIIRNRVNQLGVAEPLVMRQGADRIVVELPGVQDTARAKEILGATATLEFRKVDEDADPASAAAGRVPPGSEVFYDRRTGRPVVLKKDVILTGNHITGANSSFDEYQRPQVNIDLDGQGGNKMSHFTKDNIGKTMATLFVEYKATGRKKPDGSLEFEAIKEVINVATIQARLARSFRITGIDSPNEAQNLALLLRAGALIAPIQIVEERTVGPSLGQENIDLGMTAIVWGFCLVLAFMILYYRGFGVVANIALALNLVLIVGVMSLIPGATLTLPGMAGIVLTVGMAVDANVLIFERIREEIIDGKGPQKAIHQGYDSAFSTIADANITTFIAAVILFAVGTGPIKGFAVTLAIGIATSMFTAIVVTRAVVNLAVGGRKVNKLSI
ncbi:protein-export membrane protein SecD [Catenovulum agarivorans DS-2]|uniref:Protein translocase subunit SecD n=1 Tax=Catenovulum agarivorans DS-2 TaxID=1328313 RepID=W7QGT1_9ALTE|nr:protein translocase subunit SecD [Catenovulum agarivorans]EWH11086.1 protein-export membrane protein SecD [Catenovulum agarivorans DS-2]